MFKKMASDALGLSDIGKVISPKDFDKTESDDYILTEDNEKIYFLIKSKSDEYCFTNLAFLHLDGESALSKKRVLKRYDYYKFPITNVFLETAGTIDLDLEITFTIGNVPMKVDIAKNFAVEIADLYKSLLAIARIQDKNLQMASITNRSLEAATQVQYSRASENPTSLEFNKVVSFAQSWLKANYEKDVQYDFSATFDKYIKN